MKNTSKNSSHLLFSGVLALTVGNVLVKIIGALLKVPLHRILGDGGMSYYNVANDLYVWLYTVSTAGVPVALSILTSDARAKGNVREVKKIFRVSLTVFSLIGFFGMLIMLVGSKAFAHLYKIDNAYYAIMAIAPTLFFICIVSVYRGYFQGHQNMVPTAVSEIIEALGKLIIGISLAKYAAAQGYEMWIVSAYTLIGLSIGTGLGMVYLFITRLCFRAPLPEPRTVPSHGRLRVHSTKKILRMILAVGIPITVSSSVLPFTNVLDGIILSNRLQSIGYAEEVVESLFGNYKTLAITMFNLPPVLIYPIASSIVPYLTAARASGNRKRVRMTLDSSLRICSLISLPCAIGMSVLSEPILKLLFPEASAKMAAPLLSVLALAIFPLAMFSITNAILQSQKLERLPILSIAAGSAVKLLSSYILIGIRQIGMYGAPIGTCLCYLTTMLINFRFMKQRTGYAPRISRVFLRPFVCAFLCGLTASLSYAGLSRVLGTGRLVTVLAILLAAAVYLFSVFRLHGVTKGDILMLPKGASIYRLLCRVKLIKEVPTGVRGRSLPPERGADRRNGF